MTAKKSCEKRSARSDREKKLRKTQRAVDEEVCAASGRDPRRRLR